ncbi:acetylornithine transaminase [Fictibacillus aquaticus]|uniref:Acetylornithine aminotransferase n=1 Tax=Fictibacillus aquaticus TaxID=2021314 RepID=A0A235F570_9BACL|nr:acetylornithine transaminase [Fictibacillus aquaticus]OYD56344.1 aspartate aminotransferase family protein [Fictibacillus aquaticus]
MSSLFPTYARKPVSFAEGKGTTLIDENGKSYLDFTSGIAVVNLGHGHEAPLNALKEQGEKLWHVSNLFENTLQEELAAILTQNTPFDLAFFCNSGAEANEAAIKLAKKHTGKNKIITFQQSFHGRTFAAMSATGQEKIKAGYGPMVSEFAILPFNDSEALLNEADENTAAVMLEVIQGEGGIIPAEPAFLEAVQEVCDEKGILLIVDEIQTGIGRTGKRYAYEHTILTPDIATVAKGLGNGYPIGAMLGKSYLRETFGPGSHGTTFGGSPLASAVGKAVVQTIFQEGFLSNTENIGNLLMNMLQEELADNPVVREIRGKGLLIGIECTISASAIADELLNSGLLVVPAGTNVIRLLPPLTVTIEEIKQAVETIKMVLEKQRTLQQTT